MSIYHVLVQGFPPQDNFIEWLSKIGWKPHVTVKVISPWILCDFDNNEARELFFKSLNGRMTSKSCLQLYKVDEKAGFKILFEKLSERQDIEGLDILWNGIFLNSDLESNTPQDEISQSVLAKSVLKYPDCIDAKLFHENKVTVSHIFDAISFSCMLESDKSRLRLMQRDMERCAGTESLADRKNLTIIQDEFYACFDGHSITFMRGKCEKYVSDDKYLMYLVDVGKSMLIPSADVYRLPEACKDIPALAYKFVLDKVVVVNEIESKRYLARYTGQQLGFQMRRMKGDSYYVICFDGIENLHVKMIGLGLLTFKELAPAPTTPSPKKGGLTLLNGNLCYPSPTR